MKTLVLLCSILTFLLFFHAESNAQGYNEEPVIAKRASSDAEFINYQPRNTFYLAPFNFLFGELELLYEHQFSARNAMVVGGRVAYNRNNRLYYYNNEESFVTSFDVKYRRYVIYKAITGREGKTKNNLYGLYLDPYVSYQFAQFTQNDPNFPVYANRFHAFSAGLDIGNRVDLAKGKITLEFAIGVAVKQSVQGILNSSSSFYYAPGGIHAIGISGFIPRANMRLGFNFGK